MRWPQCLCKPQRGERRPLGIKRVNRHFKSIGVNRKHLRVLPSRKPPFRKHYEIDPSIPPNSDDDRGPGLPQSDFGPISEKGRLSRKNKPSILPFSKLDAEGHEILPPPVMGRPGQRSWLHAKPPVGTQEDGFSPGEDPN
ncbi:MAG: hypothetical protein M1829_004720 [Trizodia sp. TS-e1964]|nr:MAG: hypothetical protein M1829_004720 [Trizodia sp. TS-e1964]